MNPKGGTEILKEQLIAQLPEGIVDNINLIGSICHPSLIQKDKVNIIWQHLSYDQPNVQYMKDRKFVDSVDYFVYVSHWQYNKFREHFQIPEYKSIVIKNATYEFKDTPRNVGGRTKLLYTSTPWRGLAVLIKAIEILNTKRDDFTLDIYSSTKIYGTAFEKSEEGKFDDLFNLCKKTKNVNLHGYTSNEDIRKAVSNAHIYAYPSIFEETSCLSAIEALSAGCKVVTTNYGALLETCAEFATMIEFDSSAINLIHRYADALNTVLDKYKNNDYKKELEMQKQYYNNYYSWNTRIEEWKNFLEYVGKKDR
jgi:glycosyltransferase involved in cell wall biosynthesis